MDAHVGQLLEERCSERQRRTAERLEHVLAVRDVLREALERIGQRTGEGVLDVLGSECCCVVPIQCFGAQNLQAGDGSVYIRLRAVHRIGIGIQRLVELKR